MEDLEMLRVVGEIEDEEIVGFVEVLRTVEEEVIIVSNWYSLWSGPKREQRRETRESLL